RSRLPTRMTPRRMAALSCGLLANGAEPGTTQPTNRNAARIAGTFVRIRVAGRHRFIFALIIGRHQFGRMQLPFARTRLFLGSLTKAHPVMEVKALPRRK